jgi:hypothetical protein
MCALKKETKVNQTPLGFPIVFIGNQGGFSCLVTGWQELLSSNMWETIGWGLWWCILEPIVELKVVQGWSTSCATSAHKNRIVPHQVRAAFQGNVWLMCNALKLSPSNQAEKGVFNYITKRKRNGLSLGDQSYHVREKTGSCVTQAFSKSSRWKSLTFLTWNDEVHRAK